MRTQFTSRERIEANRAQLFAWADEGRSYFWMAQQIGINDTHPKIVLTDAEALDVWRVLNKWVERNAEVE